MNAGDNHTAQQNPINQFSVDVLKRILVVLSEQGRTKRTNLAGKTGLNYIVCLRYVNFMKMLGWVEVLSDEEESAYVSITQIGRRVGETLSEFLEGREPLRIDYSDLSDPSQSLPAELIEAKASRELQELAADSLMPGESERTGQPKIMLIDDEPDVALTYKSFLTSEGYSVDAFREPEKAVEHFISSRPMHYDLVITDIRMREMNGLRLYQCLKTIDPSVKVIFVTALDAADELVSVVSPGPVQILRKPVDKLLFSRTVRSVLHS